MTTFARTLRSSMRMLSPEAGGGDLLPAVPSLRGRGVRGIVDLLRGAGAGARRGPGVAESARWAWQRVSGWYRHHSTHPRHGRLFARGMPVLGVALLVGGAIGTYVALRPVPKPDYMTAGLDDVFHYTLLTDEFNKLPLEERLRLIGQLVQRLRNMSAGDSMLLAAFASGIAGSAREQIEANAARLAIDVWDKHAVQYAGVPADQRDEFLESTFVDFSKMMEAMAGEPRDVTDEERIDEAKRNATRERERMRDPDRQPSGQELGRFFAFVDGSVGGRATAQERTRGLQMMRDMVRHFRGQDIATGKPAGAPSGPR